MERYKEVELEVCKRVFGEEGVLGLIEDETSRADAIVNSSDGKTYVVEIKERAFPHTAFKNEGWILELGKLEGLLDISESLNKPNIVLYINKFTDNKLAIWRVDNLKIKEDNIFCSDMNKVSNSKFNGYGRKINKCCVHLLVKNAIVADC